MANLAQIITLQIFVHTFLSAETPMFIVFLQTVLKKQTNLAQIITVENPKLGPDNNSTAYIYIYMCVCCGVTIWAKFGHLRVMIWAKYVFVCVCKNIINIAVSALV